VWRLTATKVFSTAHIIFLNSNVGGSNLINYFLQGSVLHNEAPKCMEKKIVS
jgi:hypothetical protein